MSKVFVVQEPLMRQPQTGDIVRKMDLTPAKEFGDLVFLVDWSSLKNGLDTSQLYWDIRNEMQNNQFDEKDFILLIGHPIAMGLAFRVASEMSNKVQLLDWDRHNNCYNVVTFDRGEL